VWPVNWEFALLSLMAAVAQFSTHVLHRVVYHKIIQSLAVFESLLPLRNALFIMCSSVSCNRAGISLCPTVVDSSGHSVYALISAV
jgi:hypothetical protein